MTALPPCAHTFGKSQHPTHSMTAYFHRFSRLYSYEISFFYQPFLIFLAIFENAHVYMIFLNKVMASSSVANVAIPPPRIVSIAILVMTPHSYKTLTINTTRATAPPTHRVSKSNYILTDKPKAYLLPYLVSLFGFRALFDRLRTTP